MQRTNMYEARRYTCVALHHPKLRSIGNFADSLGSSIGERMSVVSETLWAVERLDYLTTRSYYPPPAASSEVEPSRTREIPHALYVGTAILPISSEPRLVTLVASPYVRLLDAVLTGLNAAMSPPSLTFVRFDMRRLYQHFESSPGDTLRATRVSVRVTGEAGLELVSLSGRNPLRSELRHAIQEVAEPYGVRLDVGRPGRRASRVHLDRHGNIWWYLNEEQEVKFPLLILAALGQEGFFQSTRVCPLRRRTDDDE